MSLDRRGLLALLAASPAWSAVDCADAPGQRPAIYAAGNGEARFSNLRYRDIE